jgi:NAD(P)-dependent dehydrogenase (short-subunit alcohol dehydrogenase family)
MSYVLVTGAAKRIGASIVEHLALQGWNIILHYNSAAVEAVKLQSKIVSMGIDCVLWQQDFTQQEGGFSDLCEKYSIKLIINNASIFLNDNLRTISFENLERHMRVNCWQPIKILQDFVKINKKSNLHVINIVDSIIFHKPDIFTSYFTSRVLLNEMTKIAAKDLAPQVRINSVALGHILKGPKQSVANFNQNRSSTPLKINGTIKEICATISYLENIKSVTGQVIILDGGAHLTDKW